MVKITQNGIYRLSMAQYHGQPCAGPSVSSSGLRTIFAKSPAHFWVTSSLNPDAEPQKETDAFVLGRAAHHLLLGEDDFSTLFVMRPDKFDSWRSREAREWREMEEAAGRTVLLPSQIDQIRGMARSLAKHPLIQHGILNGDVEQSMVWLDEESGIWLKARPDAIPNDSGDMADLKTTVETGFRLDYSVFDYRYDMQAALAKWGLKACLGRDMTDFSFVFVEKDAPHCVDILTLDPEDIARAELDLRTALRTLRYCLDHNDWFGPSGTQRDARYVSISERAKLLAGNRREFLEREIAPPQTEGQSGPTAVDYLSTP